MEIVPSESDVADAPTGRSVVAEVPPARPIAVLIAHDSESEFLVTRGLLAGAQSGFVVEWAARFEEARAMLREGRHDVVLVDRRIGGRSGLELAAEAADAPGRPPVILLGAEGQPTAGVADALPREELSVWTLERTILHALERQRLADAAALAQERYALAGRAASDGIWDWDLVRDHVQVSPRFLALLGLPTDTDISGPSGWLALVHEDDRGRLRQAIDEHLAGAAEHLELEVRMQHCDGDWRWILVRGIALTRPGRGARRIAGSISDVTERRVAQRKLEHEALHDALTGLPNRILFMDRLGQGLGRCRRDPAVGCAVLLVDLDRFKLINDSLGHGTGDRLLVAFAARLAGALRPGDTVARLGADEFGLLLEGIVDEAAAEVVGERLLDTMRAPFNVDGRQLFLSASVGIAASMGESSAAELLRNAGTAMNVAKRDGRSRCAIFRAEMHRRVVDRLARENELRAALEGARLGVHYQPIVDLATGSVRAFEALVRWPCGRSPISPTEFVPIAEDTGIIGVLGTHVMQTSLFTLARWREEGLVDDGVYMSVNVSSRQFEDPALPCQIQRALERAGLPAKALRLELTESTVMKDAEQVHAVLCELSRTGIRLHLDDFGTGYSSLGTLHRLPIEALKIDRSFIATLLDAEGENDAIVRSTIALAHSLGLHVIAEGIEEPIQLRRLRTVGCEYGQGFLFSHALEEEHARELLLGWSARETALLGDVA